MIQTLKRLSLGLVLIAAASALLLVTDPSRNRTVHHTPHIAILQFAVHPLLDVIIDGIRQGLQDQGFEEGKTLLVDRFNAHADVATARSIAAEITGGSNDLVMTLTTPCLQAVGKANDAGKTLHVFCAVTDPFAAGVGLDRAHPYKHPRHIVGAGSFEPIANNFRMARRLYPGLKKVGMVWNPGEANSQASIPVTRGISTELGIELLEANADNSSAVLEAADSLVSRDVEALFVPGDNVALIGLEAIIGAGRRGGIPVFSAIAGNADRGTLFDVGADSFRIGVHAGELAGKLLRGADPMSFPIENYVPEVLLINKTALEGLRGPWRFPEDVLQAADVVIDESGRHERKKATVNKSPKKPAVAPAKTWKLDVIEYIEIPDVEEAVKGVRKGLADEKMAEGRDFEMRVRCAQGDMPTLNLLVEAAKTEGTDLLIPLSTPSLQAALGRGGKLPIVFTVIANPFLAGAGRTNEDHLPNVTGISTLSPFKELLEIVRQCLPRARHLGTLFVPSEINSVYNMERLTEEGKKLGFTLVAVPVSTSSEVTDAAASLCTRGIDAVCQIGGSLTTASFTTIAQTARKMKVPIFGVLSSMAPEGAALVVTRDYFDGGRDAGPMIARVIRGESPGRIPFRHIEKSRMLVNMEAARAMGVRIPASILKSAEKVQ